jgi:hypothetical protein
MDRIRGMENYFSSVVVCRPLLSLLGNPRLATSHFVVANTLHSSIVAAFI